MFVDASSQRINPENPDKIVDCALKNTDRPHGCTEAVCFRHDFQKVVGTDPDVRTDPFRVS